MTCETLRAVVVVVCISALLFGTFPAPMLAQERPITGTIAGRVFHKHSKLPVADVVVNAQLVTTDTAFSGRSNAVGSYVIPHVEAGIYALSLSHESKEYPIDGHFDVRAATRFLLEGCFEIDPQSQKATLQPECESGLYAEAQVVSLGPHKYFLERGNRSPNAIDRGAQALSIQHDGLDCIVSDYYPQINADLLPVERVESGRVFFRAAQESNFYYVDMVNTGAGYQAILPKPAPGTEQVVYYIEGIDRDFNPVVTPKYTPDVTDSETCERRDPAAAYFTGENPAIAVGATVAGAASVPPGFLSTGIGTFISASGTVTYAAAGIAAAATGAGMGTTGLVLIIGGAAGAAAVIGVIATREEEASPIQ